MSEPKIPRQAREQFARSLAEFFVDNWIRKTGGEAMPRTSDRCVVAGCKNARIKKPVLRLSTISEIRESA